MAKEIETLRKIKFRTKRAKQPKDGQICLNTQIYTEKKSIFTVQAFKQLIMQTAKELWGDVDSIKLVLNQITQIDENMFKLVLPSNQKSAFSTLLFFMNEFNSTRLRVKVCNN